ncbi:MAG: aminopeptidase [Crocinitomicaceae bacterium]|nr:aminopeptidase [Crocinitomicaceae bacterium]
MNFRILIVAIFANCALTYAQLKTNVEGSKFEFKKVISHDASPVESQGRTGTCWSFSALSFLESEIMRINKTDKPILLSEMFIVRKAYEAKAQKYIRMDGNTNFGQGGAFHDIPYVIKNYGIVPQSVYTGLKKKSDTYNHSEMFKKLNEIVVKAKADGKGIQKSWVDAYNAVLDEDLGELPETFKYKGEKYTPKTFYNSLGIDMNDYLSITSFTNHPIYSKCMLEIPDNWLWDESYNVSLDEMYETVLHALKSGYTVAWGADVSEKGFSFKNGLAIVPIQKEEIVVEGEDNENFSDAGADKKSSYFTQPDSEVEVTQKMRQEGYDHKETTDDHGMHIVGLYKDKKGRNFFLVKNSWGTSNYPKGYLYVSESYFKLKTINIYLHKDAIQDMLASKLGLN